MKQDKVIFGSQEAATIFIEYFYKQLKLLEKLYQHQFTNLRHLDDTRLGNLYLLLFSIQRTGVSIFRLAKEFNVNDCYILARSFLERSITYTYILNCDEEEYQNYLRYTKQKTFRNLDRRFKVGESEVSLSHMGTIDLEKQPELKKAIDIFTSKSGKAKTRWTNNSLSKMLEIIEAKGQAFIVGLFMFATLWIYDDASEALHGTLYGAMFHFGEYSDDRKPTEEEIMKSYIGRLCTTMEVLGLCIHALLIQFNTVEPISDFVKESKENIKETHGKIKIDDSK